MHKRSVPVFTVALALAAALGGASRAMPAQAQTPYSKMAPVDQYMIADRNAEIALARSGAPASVSDGAEVMVLGREGYTTAVKGTNGFLCIVERGWGTATSDPQFWNPKVRSPICFNAEAARTFAPIYLMKTRLALAGKSPKEILAAIDAGFASGELPALAQGAMCYMLSKQQYLNDADRSWHPHLMFFVAGDAAKSWGANLDGSPVIAANDPEERVTIMMVWVAEWSDGTPGPPIKY